MANNEIKTITPIECPHCKLDLFVEFVNKPTEVVSVFNQNSVNKAKNRARQIIEDTDIDPQAKQDILNWVNNDETIFSENEVDEIVKSLKK